MGGIELLPFAPHHPAILAGIDLPKDKPFFLGLPFYFGSSPLQLLIMDTDPTTCSPPVFKNKGKNRFGQASYANAAKRKATFNQQFPSISVNTPYRPSRQMASWLNKDSTRITKTSLPKGPFAYGVRILFGHSHELLSDKCKAAAAQLFGDLDATTIDPCNSKGYFDIGFATEAGATAAATRTLMVGGRVCAMVRTRLPDSDTLCISLDRLPSGVKRANCLQLIAEGLSQYGTIVSLEMDTDPIVPQYAQQKAFAVITPSEKVCKNVQLIPRRAYLEGTGGHTFNINPEGTLPTCNKCEGLGHACRTCTNIAEDKVTLLSDMMDEEATVVNAESAGHPLFPLEWGSYQEYVLTPTPPPSRPHTPPSKKVVDQKPSEGKSGSAAKDTGSHSHTPAPSGPPAGPSSPPPVVFSNGGDSSTSQGDHDWSQAKGGRKSTDQHSVGGSDHSNTIYSANPFLNLDHNQTGGPQAEGPQFL